MNAPVVDRRDFLKSLGGGIFVFVALGETSFPAELLGQERVQRGYPDDFNAYLRIGGDGRVTVFSGKIEMGQGVVTSLAQMAAEELGVSVDAVDMVMGDTATCVWDMGTWGSLSTRMFGPALRTAAAKAREVLVELAAEELGADVADLRVEDGAVYQEGRPDRRVGFGDLAAGEPIARTVERAVVLKAARDFRVMGRSVGRTDAVEKVTGRARYTGDIRLPGMLRARVLRPPAHGATLRSLDTSAAEAVPGVVVVNEDGLVAVLHEDPEVAERALDLVRAEFDVPDSALDPDTIFDHLLAHAPRSTTQVERGDMAAGAAASAGVVEATYHDGYVAHAPMEPHTALARVGDGKATLWISTQTPFGDQGNVARTLGLAPENVRVITPPVGGGFGGKSSSGQALEAARLARATGRPVQVMWTRAEEFFNDTFRPAAVIQVRAGADAEGRMALWDYTTYMAGARGSEVIYDVPNARVVARGAGSSAPGAHPFATGAWRAPGASTNTFARESHVDVLAARAGVDPLEFRLRNLSDARMRRVLETVAERAGWQPGPTPTGRGMGIACGIDAGTYVAHVAEVEVDRATGRIRVVRVVCAQDMGIVVNPEGATMQMEGCITMGLGYALFETLRFRGGQVLDRNFGTYRIPRFTDLPDIETVLVENDELDPQGGGEPAIVCMGAVLANAVFDATGARLTRMPMIPERVKAALDALPG